MNRKGFEFSFAWFFAIIVGASILFMTIYMLTNIIDTGEETSATLLGQKINVLLNPLEISVQEGKVNYFSISPETRIYPECSSKNIFGSQKILTSQFKTNSWSEKNGEGEFYNKYIFSEEYVEGRKFYIFSKPFKPMFKVNDFMMLIPEDREYCFKEAPEDIKEYLELLNTTFMKIGDAEEEYMQCSEDSIEVCFGGGNCEIEVDINSFGGGKIIKDSDEIESGEMYFIGDEENNAMIFAGIFSSPEIYECQVERTMKRLGLLSNLYEGKINLVDSVGCNSNVDFGPLVEAIQKYEDSKDIARISDLIAEINEKTIDARCKIW